jgi:hypothetical protein
MGQEPTRGAFAGQADQENGTLLLTLFPLALLPRMQPEAGIREWTMLMKLLLLTLITFGAIFEYCTVNGPSPSFETSWAFGGEFGGVYTVSVEMELAKMRRTL